METSKAYKNLLNEVEDLYQAFQRLIEELEEVTE